MSLWSCLLFLPGFTCVSGGQVCGFPIIVFIWIIVFKFWCNSMWMQQDFFRKLMELFRICEDLENIDGLHMIYKIARGICKYYTLPYAIKMLHTFVCFIGTNWCVCCFSAVMLNSPQIFEKIFGDELIMDIIGCLECKFCFYFFRLS